MNKMLAATVAALCLALSSVSTAFVREADAAAPAALSMSSSLTPSSHRVELSAPSKN
jgi:hypothetical protein